MTLSLQIVMPLCVPFHEVEYVMTDEPHRLALVTLDRIVYFYGALKEIEIIDERLFRCHQSYIVNTKQMSSYDAKQKMIVLKSGNAFQCHGV